MSTIEAPAVPICPDPVGALSAATRSSPPSFDTARQISTLFAVSDAANRRRTAEEGSRVARVLCRGTV